MASARLLRRRLAVGAAVALLGVAMLYVYCPQMPVVAMPRRGRVVDRVTGKPVPGALVFLTYSIIGGGTLRPTVQLETRWTETDADGRFSFGLKLFDDVGTRWMLWSRRPDVEAYHREYYVGGVGFESPRHRFPYAVVPIRLKPFESEEEIRKMRLDPRKEYRDPRYLQEVCSGLSEPACMHLCEWLYALPLEECARLRRTL